MKVINKGSKGWMILPLKPEDIMILTIRDLGILGDIVDAERNKLLYIYSFTDSNIYSKLQELGLITINERVIDKTYITSTPQGRNIIDSILKLSDLLIKEL